MFTDGSKKQITKQLPELVSKMRHKVSTLNSSIYIYTLLSNTIKFYIYKHKHYKLLFIKSK